MATFANKTFNSAAYLACRPSYPQSIVETIISYLNPASLPSPRIALDLGCGPGQLTQLLADSNSLNKVIGTDPSSGMIDKAMAMAGERGRENSPLEYYVASAEKLDRVGDEEVSLVTAAQAAHWFDHTTVYRELARVLRPGGVAAYLGYGEFYMPGHPRASGTITAFMRVKLGPYWERPGRTLVEEEYDPIPFPDASLGFDPSSYQRIKYNLESSSAYRPTQGPIDERRPPVLIREWTKSELAAYINTTSSIHTYESQHPGPDLTRDFVDELGEIVGGEWANGEGKERVVWPLTLMLMKKKG